MKSTKHVRRRFVELFVSFAIGAGWALSLIGSVALFLVLYPLGFVYALTIAFFLLFAGLSLTLFFELFSAVFEGVALQRRSVELLEELVGRKATHDENEGLSDH